MFKPNTEIRNNAFKIATAGLFIGSLSQKTFDDLCGLAILCEARSMNHIQTAEYIVPVLPEGCDMQLAENIALLIG